MTLSLRRIVAPVLLFVAVLPAASCDLITGAGSRKLEGSILCDDAGECRCEEGAGDCDGDPNNGCEIWFEDDPDNCGGCGQVCGTGECANSVCGPEELTFPGFVYNFIIAADQFYFSPMEQPGLWRVPVAGGPLERLDPNTWTEFAYQFAFDGAKVYWSSDTMILSTDVASGATETLATDQYAQDLRVAVGGGKVYWANVDADNTVSIHRTAATGGGPVETVVVLQDVNFLNDFAVTPKGVYWSGGDRILYSPHDTISESLFQAIPPPSPAYFEPTPKTLLYTGAPGGVYELPIDGGTPKQLADIEGYGWLTSDAYHVYFLNRIIGKSVSTTLWRVSHEGTEPPVKLADSPSLAPAFPVSLYGEHIYWLDQTKGHIVRVPK